MVRLIGLHLMLLKFCFIWLLYVGRRKEDVVQAILEVILSPEDGYMCPSQNITCRVELVTVIRWTSNFLGEGKSFFVSGSPPISTVERENSIVSFTVERNNSGDHIGNVTSSIISSNPYLLNGSNITCEAALDLSDIKSSSITSYVIGPASAPRDLSVVWDDPNAVVSFQSPVYGGECVEYYIVTAVSEEEGRNISCNATSDGDRYNCRIHLDGSANDYNFTVYGVTPVNGGLRLHGESATGCYLLFPENATATENECGVNTTLNITWKGRHENTTISKRRVNSSGPTHYERADSEDYHLLTLDYSETGPVEIAVIFSSPVCNKTTVTQYMVERILMSVSLKYPILVIESRDCITSPENYRIVVTSTDSPSTELVNVSFNTTIEHNVGDVVRPNTQYTIRVQLAHISSNNTIIDEMNVTILYSSPTPTPTPSPGVTEVNPTTTDDGDQTVVIVAAAAGGVVGLLVLVTGTGLLALCLIKKCKFNKHGSNEGKGIEMKILTQQCSVVSEAPPTPAPPLPDTEEKSYDTPDAPAPLYDDLNTLTRMKGEQSAEHMYHVLECPTSPEQTQEQSQEQTQEEQQETEAASDNTAVYAVVDKSAKKKKKNTDSATSVPIYSVVDKSKKKKRRRDEQTTIEQEVKSAGSTDTTN